MLFFLLYYYIIIIYIFIFDENGINSTNNGIIFDNGIIGMKIKAISAAIVIGSIYFILLDELIIGSAQRRIGPFNVG